MSEIKAITETGIINFILTKEQETFVLSRMVEPYAKAKAEQEELSKTYDAKALKTRLNINSLTTIYKLLESGELKARRLGKKCYRVDEIEVRRFFSAA